MDEIQVVNQMTLEAGHTLTAEEASAIEVTLRMAFQLFDIRRALDLDNA